ncbi:substrate-binding periplasmic protein [Inhella proteolytica]|uniref:Transporter substrate-binding domain-containing protein n=1 Tax=Inhella proteolytica TaxID=2795029 RepID=A0A931NG47_9BURK|nr:transporter substrate-binding domain-containing protein [Inhella proteolytica]MBH9576781.1 transporter substrate-binding domain-containing protein [Inhella proteolytica]
MRPLHGPVSGLLAALLGSQSLACGPLRMAYYEYPGLYERQPGGAEVGFEVDLRSAMEERSGCRLEPVYLSSKRAWLDMAEARMDLMASALQTPERARKFDFLLFARTRALLLIPKPVPAGLGSREAFEASKARVMIVRGTSYTPRVSAWLERLRAQGRVSEAGDMPSALRAFGVGRAEALLIYPMALVGRETDWLERHQLQDWWPEETAYGGWALNRQTVSAADRQRLREAAESLRADGTLQRLGRRHFGPLAVHMLK